MHGGVGYVETAKATGRESSCVSRSLIAVLPVMAGMRCCLIASYKGRRELVRWGLVRIKYVHLLMKRRI